MIHRSIKIAITPGRSLCNVFLFVHLKQYHRSDRTLSTNVILHFRAYRCLEDVLYKC